MSFSIELFPGYKACSSPVSAKRPVFEAARPPRVHFPEKDFTDALASDVVPNDWSHLMLELLTALANLAIEIVKVVGTGISISAG
ncbi:hypothetical protein [Nocardia arthritidis]|uniref:Uncharacterized protein n=1 Tax=Nocardia arthritidis TaxID=228602 RepID=A0A6G9YEK4_9NOCA|nr:hypothetical protein [Nocardia arthritidis]QIS11507.1 hypothetical protein F5544_18165 [Nocardia arthritidis]